MKITTRVSHHRFTGLTRPSLHNGFTAYVVLSPVTGLFCHRRSADRPQNLTPASGCQDHTILPSAAAPFVYAGAAIMSPSLFADAPAGEFSLTKMFDRANEQERLFGLRLDGVWMHVGTPDAVQAAEEAFLASVA